ncbi:MAG: hypothetical protein WCA81_03880 [Rhizomicrobium sp.]
MRCQVPELVTERPYRPVSRAAGIGKIRQGFQHELKRPGFEGNVRSCKNAIAIPFAANSLGAICEVRGKAQSLLICENNMHGGVAFTSTFVWTGDRVHAKELHRRLMSDRNASSPIDKRLEYF